MNIFTERSITTFLSDWCSREFASHDSPGRKRYEKEFQALLDLKRAEQRTQHSNGGRFGMSSAGGCLRAAAYKRAGVKGEPEGGDTLVTWEIGHLLEIMGGAILTAAGFKVTRRQETIWLDPAFQSAIDGVLEDGPVPLPYPLLLSLKTNSYKSSQPPRGNSPAKRYGFAGLPLDGIAAAQPGWNIQAQLEMAATGMEHELVLVIAKDMIAAFKSDPIFNASGSLSFYAEVLLREHSESIDATPLPTDTIVAAYSAVMDREPSWVLPIYFTGANGPVTLPSPGDVESGWKGHNQVATGRFNPCFSCGYASICRTAGTETPELP